MLSGLLLLLPLPIPLTNSLPALTVVLLAAIAWGGRRGILSPGTVAVLVGFAVFGKIPLTVGVIGHEGSTVIVVMNSLRLLFMSADNMQLKKHEGVDDGS